MELDTCKACGKDVGKFWEFCATCGCKILRGSQLTQQVCFTGEEPRYEWTDLTREELNTLKLALTRLLTTAPSLLYIVEEPVYTLLKKLKVVLSAC